MALEVAKQTLLCNIYFFVLRSLVVVLPVAGLVHALQTSIYILLAYAIVPSIGLILCLYFPLVAGKIEDPWEPDFVKGGILIFAGSAITLGLLILVVPIYAFLN